MRKVMMTVPCLLLALSASAAESAVDHGPLPSLEDLARVQASNPQFKEAAESRQLFFRLANSSAREVLFGVTVAGHPYLQEQVTPGATTETAPSIELLARDPARLARLYTLAANESARVEVAVFVDGAEAGRFSFQEFVRYNQDIKSGGLRPVAGTSELRLLAPDPTLDTTPRRAASAPQPDGPCEDQCYWDYLDCRDIYCNTGCFALPCPLNTPRLPGCAYCTTQYNNCLAACPPPICTDPKSVTTYSTTELVGVASYYWDCFRSWWDPSPFPTYGDWYEALQLTYKVTSYQRTEYCNGNVVVEVTGVSYAYAYCNHPLYFTCFYPWTYPYNVCY